MGRITRWPPWEITSLREKLDDLAGIVELSAKDLDPDVLIWMTRMLVVRSSGFLEQTANEVCKQHIEHKSGGVVRTFAQSWLVRSRNPSPEYLCDLVGRFDASLQGELLTLLDDDDQFVRRELSFLVDRRNKIAHGLNESVGRDKALQLKDVALRVSDWLIVRFNPM